MYKAIKNKKIIAISDIDSKFFMMNLDSIEEDNNHNSNDYEQYNGEYILKSEIPQSKKEDDVRNIRNNYLEKYVDPYQLTLRWNSLSDEEQINIRDYRQYLLDYTETENWWKENPLTYIEWLQSQEEPLENITE